MEATRRIQKVEKKISGRQHDTLVITTIKVLNLSVSGKEKPGMEDLNETDLLLLTPEELDRVEDFLDGKRNIKSTISKA